MQDLEICEKICKIEKEIEELRKLLRLEQTAYSEFMVSFDERIKNNSTILDIAKNIDIVLGILQRKNNVYRSGLANGGMTTPPAFKNLPITEIIADYATGMSWKELERKYGVSNVTIRKRLKQLGIYDDIKEDRQEYKKLNGINHDIL